MHTISWKEITKPKKIGGLDLTNINYMNEVFISKLGWKIKTGENTLWCEFMCGKYGRKSTNDNEVHAQVYDTSMWKQIVSLWPMLDKMYKWVLDNG